MEKCHLFLGGYLTLAVSVALLSILNNQEPDHRSTSLQSPSQLDTELDVSSVKDFFEYQLSTQGEQTLNKIIHNFDSDSSAAVFEGSIEQDLFHRYIEYKQALLDLNPSPSSQLSLQHLIEIEDVITKLQDKFFTHSEKDRLFGQQNLLRRFTIQKQEIMATTRDPLLQQQLLDDLLSQQPSYIQQVNKNNQLIMQLASTSQLNLQDKYIQHVSLVGEKGAKRLQDLENQQRDFQAVLSGYLQQRDDILEYEGLSTEQKNTEVALLRTQSFAKQQQRRVQALERIYDNQR
ncbi:lipase secretion chaperone [Vibrio sagamiensis]|uniref:Lipase chaperone n=1 Tax=Vibrio sagamiensis NBRC 104589 TaxID=1219064 RepID=A0A511QDF6_9VIBR|nr:lipase secretion chaperone [Vibrio sagamiensis]PNQ61651.1 lipase chaperone [Vibrio agarivorans]GEM74462.1 lipase chaperone [Vibrio sagamiensis NBRC 104589]